MAKSGKLKVNPIMEGLKGKGRVQKLKGYVGEDAGDKVALYLDLSATICLELDREDIVHVVDSDDPAEPSLVFVRGEARVSVRQETTASVIGQSGLGGCGCQGGAEGEGVGIIALISNGGGLGTSGKDCATRRTACKKKCKKADPLIRQGCIDSCDAAYRLCRGPIGGGLGGVIMF